MHENPVRIFPKVGKVKIAFNISSIFQYDHDYTKKKIKKEARKNAFSYISTSKLALLAIFMHYSFQDFINVFE